MRARKTWRQRIWNYHKRNQNATSSGAQAKEEVPRAEAEDPGRIESLVPEAWAGDAWEGQALDSSPQAGGIEVVEQVGRLQQLHDDGGSGDHAEPAKAEDKKAVAPKKKRAPVKKKVPGKKG